MSLFQNLLKGGAPSALHLRLTEYEFIGSKCPFFYVHVIPTSQIITRAILIACCGKHRLDKMLVKLKLTVNIPVLYTTYKFLPRVEGVVGLTYLLRKALLYSAPM